MTVYLTTEAGKEIAISNPLTAECKSDLYGAAVFKFTAAADSFFGDFKEVRAVEGGAAIFRGRPDKQTESFSEKGRILSLEARDFSAVLLDNEALPAVYNTASLQDIYHRHVQGYGLGLACGVNPRYNGTFTVTKGMSEFETVEKFCRLCSLPRPYVNRFGQLSLRNYDRTENIVGNGVILSAARIRNKYKPLTEIILNDAETMTYSIPVRNTAFAGLPRKRYKRLFTLTRSEQYSEARRVLAKSMYGNFEYEVAVSGAQTAEVGSKTGFSFGGIGGQGLRIAEKVILLRESGILTKYLLVPTADIY